MAELEGGAVAEVETSAGLDLGSMDTGGETGAESTAVETPATGVEETVQPNAETETPEGEEGQQPQKQTEIDPELTGLDPKYHKDKTVKGMYFAIKALRGAYPGGVKEAVEFRQKVDQFGGIDGITDLQTQRAGWEQIDRDFAEGNPQLIEDWSSENPDGFSKLVPGALDKYQQVDPEGYNHALGKVFWNTMQQYGVTYQIGNLESALGRNDVEGAKQELAKIGQFLKDIHGFAANVPQKKGPTPEQQKFQQEREQFEQQKRQEFQNSVLGETRTYAIGKIEAQLSKEFSARSQQLAKLKESDPESFQILLRNCYEAVNSAIGKDAAAFERFQAAVGAGKREDALRIARSRIDTVFSDAVSRTYKAFTKLGGGAPSTPAATQQATPPQNGSAQPTSKPANGIMPLAKMPDPGQVDKLRMYAEYGKEKADSMIWKGQVHLKGKRGLYQLP